MVLSGFSSWLSQFRGVRYLRFNSCSAAVSISSTIWILPGLMDFWASGLGVSMTAESSTPVVMNFSTFLFIVSLLKSESRVCNPA